MTYASCANLDAEFDFLRLAMDTMMTLPVPKPVGPQQWDSLRGVLEEIRTEHQRMVEFATQLSEEWNEIHGRLLHCQTALEQDHRTLTKREAQLETDRVHLDSAWAEARRASDRLGEMEGDLQSVLQSRSQWDAERLRLRQQLTVIHEGFSSLAETVELVQSSHGGLHQAASVLQQRAAQLSEVLAELPTVEATAGHAALVPQTKAVEHVADVELDVLQDVDRMVDDTAEYLGCESDPEPTAAEPGGDPLPSACQDELTKGAGPDEAHSADPVVGSVLAELARFVKSEAG